MEWFFLPWTFTAYLTGTFDQTGWQGIERNRYEPPGPADKWLIEIVYEMVAAETRCKRCGAPLDSPRLRAGAWPVRVTTRCRGSARHRHRADVSRTQDGLHTNPLIRA
ncbi:hypothetical protein EDD27_8896 [Nonomuraea polychroma]|uniref:Transposase n=1 Tax=Nonomuraea polychroma TaxID=46176 RepID=A0A438MK48_9ACTN|nr:hypothetical protein [Nonomuraea polychroma]RVX46053.1 hypothetical protein EDD27_8896 [Nonomuraea polychroma]